MSAIRLLTEDWLLDATLAPDSDGDVLAPLYEGAARGDLVLPSCADCGQPLDLEQCVCDGCGSGEITWGAVGLAGTVHTATTVHRLEPGLVRTSRPYPVIDVELRSGHRLIMTTVDGSGRTPRIGEIVSIAFRHLGGVAVPAVKPIISRDTEVNHDKY